MGSEQPRRIRVPVAEQGERINFTAKGYIPTGNGFVERILARRVNECKALHFPTLMVSCTGRRALAGKGLATATAKPFVRQAFSHGLQKQLKTDCSPLESILKVMRLGPIFGREAGRRQRGGRRGPRR